MAAEKTRRKSKLGRYMQALRRRRPELRPENIAPMVRVAATTITRMEGGYTVPNFTLLQALLGIYGATEDERAEAVTLWEDAKQDSTIVEHAASLPPKYRAFRRAEADASMVRTLSPISIPGLLQTAGYAAALAEAATRFNPAGGWGEKAGEERRSRQKLLDGHKPLKLHALIDESVLHRAVGGASVMTEQLRRLITVGGQDNVTIQIVPFRLGAYGPMSGPMTILTFDDPSDPEAVYLEYPGGGEWVENVEDVAAFVGTFADVSSVALPPHASMEIIESAVKTFED